MQLFVRMCGQNTAVLELPPAATISDLGSRLIEHIDNFADMRILCGTRSLDHLSSNVVLEEIGIRTETTIQVVPRFRGGGGDGGATGAESRSSYLEMYAKKKTLKVNPKEEKLAAWTQCRLTHEPLSTSEEGVVVDPLGYLYNKEAVLQALLENRQTKKGMPAGLEHIRSLKDLAPLKLSRPGTSAEQAKESKPTTSMTFQPGNESDFCCPLTGRPMSGTARFVALKPCGWVFSESAVKQAAPAVEEMIGTKLEDQEILPINGTEDEVVALSEKLSEKRLKSKKSGKVQDKRKAGDNVEAAGEKAAKVQKWNGCDDMATVLARKEAEKYTASNHVPEGATKSVYASIFTSSSVFNRKETYGARNLSLQR